MRNKLGQISLILAGVLVGIAISLNYSAIAQRDSKVANTTLPIEEMRAFTEVFDRIKRDYVESVDDKKLFTEAITGMLSGLDPHSAYLNQDAFREMQVGTQGEFGGLGIEVGMEDGYVKVISPIDDTPASHAGVLAGDLIVKLDDTSVKGLTLNDAVKLMRGKPNTKIRVTIVRKGEPNPIVITLERAVIKIQSVKSTTLEPGYVYFRVTQFQETSGEMLAQAIVNQFKANPDGVKGIVLDLRNNPGGLLTSAVSISGAFIEKGKLVVYTEGRAEDSKMQLKASPEYYLHGPNQKDFLKTLPAEIRKVPMVVLVNEGSASASEIVAGALQDHQRAVVMGQQSFGKGSVQTILPLGGNTAIKLTTARYFTPNGRSIQAKGITPDLPLEPAVDKAASIRLHEADLVNHLKVGKPTPDNKPKDKDLEKEKQAAATYAKYQWKPALPRPEIDIKDLRPVPGEIISKNDYELQQAVSFLKSRSATKSATETH